MERIMSPNPFTGPAKIIGTALEVGAIRPGSQTDNVTWVQHGNELGVHEFGSFIVYLFIGTENGRE
jgi:hypothetical protein